VSAYISRVIRGKCIWEYAPVAVEAPNKLLAADAFAHGDLMGLIEDSSSQCCETGNIQLTSANCSGRDFSADTTPPAPYTSSP
jgi:hypothetical protein